MARRVCFDTDFLPDDQPEPGMILSLKSGGFDVWCDGYRTVSANQYGGGVLVFLSVFGTQAAVRALWARAVSGKKHVGFDINGEYVRIEEGVRHVTLRSMLDGKNLHAVLMHPRATSMVSAFDRIYYLLGRDPEKQFWTRFNRMCQVPMREVWRERIWTLGIEKDLIAPLPGIGLPAHRIDTDTKTWSEIVCEAVKTGVLK